MLILRAHAADVLRRLRNRYTRSRAPSARVERICAILAFALRHRASALRWKRHDDGAVQIAAEPVLAHLELSNVELRMRPPAPWHSAGE